MDKKTVNILFCGIGGQGVLKASEICGLAAIFNGYSAKKSEVHGMSQRGGSVESHLRFGKVVYSPLINIGEADILVPFFKAEALRFKNYLKKGGINLIEYLAACDDIITDKRFENTFMLGVLSRYVDIKEESWIRAIEDIFMNKSTKENIEVFFKGKECKL